MKRRISVLSRVHCSGPYKDSCSEHDEVNFACVVKVDIKLLNFIGTQLKLIQDTGLANTQDFTFLSFHKNNVDFFHANPNVEFLLTNGFGFDEALSRGVDDTCTYVMPDFEADDDCEDHMIFIRALSLHIGSDSFYWSGFDENFGFEGYVETDRFRSSDLECWKNHLMNNPPDAGMTYADLLNRLSGMSSDVLQHKVWIKDNEGNMIGLSPILEENDYRHLNVL